MIIKCNEGFLDCSVAGSTHLFLKGPEWVVHCSCSPSTVVQKRQGRYLHKWAWLCSSPLLMKTGGGLDSNCRPCFADLFSGGLGFGENISCNPMPGRCWAGIGMRFWGDKSEATPIKLRRALVVWAGESWTEVQVDASSFARHLAGLPMAGSLSSCDPGCLGETLCWELTEDWHFPSNRAHSC